MVTEVMVLLSAALVTVKKHLESFEVWVGLSSDDSAECGRWAVLSTRRKVLAARS